MFDIQEELKKLPDKPGVYIMRDENRNIIYVGKAVVLKNRVRQYFQSSVNMTAKTQAMVAKIKEFEYIVTGSEMEALILECNLIKRHRPKFNILLKDDKSYSYIKVTLNEEYPRVMATRSLEKDGARYFGPYPNGTAVKETLELIKRLFPIKMCSKVFPRDIGKERPCLNYHIYQCLGPCQGDVNKEEYKAMLKDVCSFLNGKQDGIVRKLESQMKEAAEIMNYERAASLRNKINALRHIGEKQKVLSTAMEDQDVVSYAADNTDACIQIFFIRYGKLIGREHFMAENAGDTDSRELLGSFVKQYYSTAAYLPGEIILKEEIEEQDIIEKWLSEKRESRVHIRVPQRGEKLQLVDMVTQNAGVSLEQYKSRMETEGAVSRDGLEGLKNLLGLEDIPERIEAYDVSNTGNSDRVASMVVFADGCPNNREYRRFKIKSVEGQNDYASMQEVLFRRFKHAEKELSDMEASGAETVREVKFSKLPDLILVDGGTGHVNAAREVLRQLGITIPVFGMVKDASHRTRGIAGGDNEISLNGNIQVLRFVTSIQDEAHRFALLYNKKLREKRYSGSALDEIEGIGPRRKKALIRHFGSVKRIKEAGIDDLAAVEGIGNDVAEKIYNFFRG